MKANDTDKKPKFMYSIPLTDEEVSTLEWLSNRGYFPAEIYKSMGLADDEPEWVERGVERVWQFPEHAAWSLLDLRDSDPEAYLACLGGKLLDKVLALENSIV